MTVGLTSLVKTRKRDASPTRRVKYSMLSLVIALSTLVEVVASYTVILALQSDTIIGFVVATQRSATLIIGIQDSKLSLAITTQTCTSIFTGQTVKPTLSCNRSVRLVVSNNGYTSRI